MRAPRWALSWRADPVARVLADRHYNRQSVGAAQFVPPGACVVLRTLAGDALWITSQPRAEYVKHDWAGAWMCSCFRNESAHLSSELITEAVAATLAVSTLPVSPLGFVTFVDPTKTRRKRDPGRCYLRAGWHYVPCRACAVVARLMARIDPRCAFPVGRCRECGGDGRARTKAGLIVLQLLPAEFPVPAAPLSLTTDLFGSAA